MLSQQEAGSSRWQSASRKSLDGPEVHRPGAADNRSPASFQCSIVPSFQYSTIPPFHHSNIPSFPRPPAGRGRATPLCKTKPICRGGSLGTEGAVVRNKANLPGVSVRAAGGSAKQSQFGGSRVNVKYSSRKGLPEIWAIRCLRKQSQFAVRDCLPRRRGGQVWRTPRKARKRWRGSRAKQSQFARLASGKPDARRAKQSQFAGRARREARCCHAKQSQFERRDASAGLACWAWCGGSLAAERGSARRAREAALPLRPADGRLQCGDEGFAAARAPASYGANELQHG